MNDSENSRVKSLAVALSGGGHRATLFVLGAMLIFAWTVWTNRAGLTNP